MITMRPAGPADSDALFRWRNDPATQAASLSTAPVPREDHERWMKFNVLQGYPTHMVMIGEGDEGTVGVVRFDSSKMDLMMYDVSLTVAPEHRGKGLGATMLSVACQWMTDYTIRAQIKRDNIASRKLFGHCGFDEVERSSGILTFRKEPVR